MTGKFSAAPRFYSAQPWPPMALLLVARHGARADADPHWRPTADHAAYNPPLSTTGRADAAALAALAAASRVTRVVTSPFARCLETAAVVVSELTQQGVLVDASVDCSLCETLTRAAVGVGHARDPVSWRWPGGSVAAAVVAAGLPRATPVSGKWPCYPEDAAVASARFADSLVGVAATAVAHTDGGGGATLIISHGDAVARAITLAVPSALVTHVSPGGVAVFRVAGEDGWEWVAERGACAGLEVAWRD